MAARSVAFNPYEPHFAHCAGDGGIVRIYVTAMIQLQILLNLRKVLRIGFIGTYIESALAHQNRVQPYIGADINRFLISVSICMIKTKDNQFIQVE